MSTHFRVREIPEELSPLVAQVILNLALENPDRLAPDTVETMLRTAELTNAEYDTWASGLAEVKDALREAITVEAVDWRELFIRYSVLVTLYEGVPFQYPDDWPEDEWIAIEATTDEFNALYDMDIRKAPGRGRA